MLPGETLHRLARRWCSEESTRRIIEPLLADFQREYLRAPGPFGRAMVLLSGYTAFCRAFTICGVQLYIVNLKTDHWTRRRTLAALMLPLMALGFGWIFAWAETADGRFPSWSQAWRTPELSTFWQMLITIWWLRFGHRPNRRGILQRMPFAILAFAFLIWCYPTRDIQIVSMALGMLVTYPLTMKLQRWTTSD